MLGGVVPEVEKRCTRHLLYHTVFGKALLHKLVLGAATLETALARADMPTKGTTTSLQKHFSEQFVNKAIRTYTKVLQAGDKPTFPLLIQMTPPQNFQTWEPDKNGQPRRWYKPWIQSTTPSHKDPSNVGLLDDKDGGANQGPTWSNHQEDEPILRMAASAEHPADTSKLTCQGATLLGYYWDLENDALTTNKNSKINLYPARRGLRPSWGEISEAEDLLPLHRKKPFTQRQALAMAHNLFDPIQSAPFLSASLKFIYSYLIISTSLAEDKEEAQCNFEKA